MSFFIVPSDSFEYSTPTPIFNSYHGPRTSHPFFNHSDYSNSTRQRHASDFIDLIRRREVEAQSRARAQAIRQAQLQAEAQRQAHLARARKEELERAYFEQVRGFQLRQLEAQKAHQQQQEVLRYRQHVESLKRKAQENYVNQLRAQQVRAERERVLLAQRQRQEQERASRGHQDPILLALEQLLSGAVFDEAKGDQASVKGKGPAGETPVEKTDEPSSTPPPAEAKESKDTQSEFQPQPQLANSDAIKPSRQLLFTHPFGSKPSSVINANDIGITVDEKSGLVTVSGLWESEPTPTPTPIDRPSSPTPSHRSNTSHSTSSSKSKKAHVNDVDENGEEIEMENGEEDGFVQLSKSTLEKVQEQLQKESTSRTFQLPEGVKAESIRAEVSEEGLKLWVEVEEGKEAIEKQVEVELAGFDLD